MGVLPNLIFLLAAAVGLVVYSGVLQFLYAYSEVKELSTAQYGVAAFYGAVLALWFGAEAGFFVARMQPRYDSIAEDEQDLVGESEKSQSSKEAEGEKSPGGALAPDSAIFCVKHSHLTALRFGAEFVAIMGFLYLCDRTTLVAKGPKYVNPYAFWGVNGAILLLALCTIRGGHAPASEPVQAHIKPLQRDQTEEWKGWMQIMFVLYHYFAEGVRNDVLLP